MMMRVKTAEDEKDEGQLLNSYTVCDDEDDEGQDLGRSRHSL